MIKRKPQQLYSQSSNEEGFTIIESLIAIIVVAILLVGIAPVIVLSTGNRIQSRRVELATQAAKTYIDGVTSGSIPAPDFTSDISNFSAPTGGSLPSCDPGKYCSNQKKLYCLDLDSSGKCTSDSSKDLIIQTFRTGTAAEDAPQGYRLGLRVYRADAFKDSGELKANSQAKYKDKNEKATQGSVNGGLGDRKAPLVEMTTDIASQQTTFTDFCSRLKQTSNTNSNCDNSK